VRKSAKLVKQSDRPRVQFATAASAVVNLPPVNPEKYIELLEAQKAASGIEYSSEWEAKDYKNARVITAHNFMVHEEVNAPLLGLPHQH
jgi:hypothetical protein